MVQILLLWYIEGLLKLKNHINCPVTISRKIDQIYRLI